MAKLRLYLIRHGETDAATTNVLDTRPPGLPLNFIGLRHAEEFAESMADRPLKAVYASLALRAQQTASALASHHGLSVQVLAGLHEVQLGDWDGRSDSETIKAYLQIFSRWLHGALDIRVPGGETGREVLERFIIDLGQVSERHAHGDIAIVSHGAAIRLVALHLARNLNRQHVDSGFLPYCSSVILERDFKASDSWRCVQWIGRRFTTFP